MHIALKIILNFCFFFLGYVIGRLTHIFNHYYTNDISYLPHHWITGLFFILLFILLKKEFLVYFFIGIVISDLKDMMELKLFEPDIDISKPIFWGID